jgi:Flp pilus assembly protein TadD
VTSDSALARAEHWLEVGRPERCLEELGQGGAEPDPRGLALQAMALRQLERWQECVDATSRGLALAPDDLELRFQRAVAVEQLGDVAQAERLLLACLEAQPRNVVLLTGYASLLLRHGHPDDAERVLRRAAVEAPGSPEVEMVRARLLMVRRRDADAVEVVRGVLAQDPTRADALWLLGALEHERGLSRQAAPRLRSAALSNLDDRELASGARDVGREARWFAWPLRLVRRLPDAAVVPAQLGVVLAAALLLGYRPTQAAGAVLLAAFLVFVAWFWIAVLVSRAASRRNR